MSSIATGWFFKSVWDWSERYTHRNLAHRYMTAQQSAPRQKIWEAALAVLSAPVKPHMNSTSSFNDWTLSLSLSLLPFSYSHTNTFPHTHTHISMSIQHTHCANSRLCTANSFELKYTHSNWVHRHCTFTHLTRIQFEILRFPFKHSGDKEHATTSASESPPSRVCLCPNSPHLQSTSKYSTSKYSTFVKICVPQISTTQHRPSPAYIHKFDLA